MGCGFYRRYGKRILDSGAAMIGLVLLLPLLLFIALLVKATSKGPVFYRQERVGRDGKMFLIVKFRSMYHNDGTNGLALTCKGDPRITSVGRYLRCLKFDELPQLWNVLRGEMSLVGPRPEVPNYVQYYSPAQRQVLSVRPGVTDPASIAYRREEELLDGQPDPDRYYREVILPQKLSMNLEYLNHMTLCNDLVLLLRTTGAVLLRSSLSTQ